MNPYEAKQAARKARLLARAEAKAAEAQSRSRAFRSIADGIPLGQPILVGHHSEKRHRRDIVRMDSHLRKAAEASKEARMLQSRAESVGTAGISSDDPEALAKLKAKHDALVVQREAMNASNKIIRKARKAGKDNAAIIADLRSQGLPIGQLSPERWQTDGFQAYELSNLGAEIRRLAKRIEIVQATASVPYQEIDFDGGKVIINPEANRVQVIHDTKPSEAVRSDLKSSGFRWARSEGAWQRHLSNAAIYHAKRIAGLAT